MNCRAPALLPVLLLAFLGAVGCGEPALDPKVVAEHRTKLTLAEEPEGAQTVLEVRHAMFGTEAAAEEHEHAEEAEHEHGDEADHADDAGDDAEEPAPGESASGESALAVEEPAEGHANENHADEEHAQEENAHEDHDHDGDGIQDHTPEEHDAVLAAKDPFAGKEPVVDQLDVVMVGTVGGVPNPSTQSHPEFPFDKNKAVFFLADPEAAAEMAEHTHEHAPGEECAFCAANAAEASHLIAVVQFNDPKGKPLGVDARDLFDLKEKEMVVVRGKARIVPGGMLVVDANGLYVRR